MIAGRLSLSKLHSKTSSVFLFDKPSVEIWKIRRNLSNRCQFFECAFLFSKTRHCGVSIQVFWSNFGSFISPSDMSVLSKS